MNPKSKVIRLVLVANERDMQVVGEASNRREVVEHFHMLRPDVLLLDLQMPEMDGMDALVAIRKVHASARIIVLTTYGSDVLARRHSRGARRPEKSQFGCAVAPGLARGIIRL